MEYLNLSIRCLLPQQHQKNCLIKIYNRHLDLHIQLENQFTHNYQYVYRLWPCQLGHQHQLQLELWEKIEGGESMKLRGTAQAKITYTYQGELYRFHGDRQEGQMFLMKFKAEKKEVEEPQSPQSIEQTELKKINNQMQQNLQKYREQIQNYQQFLYFTNNVIKELNQDFPGHQNQQVQQQQGRQNNLVQNIKIYEKDAVVEEPNGIQTPTQRKTDQTQRPEQTFRNKNTENDPSHDHTSRGSKANSIKHSLKGGSQASKVSKIANYLSKYRYLEEEEQSMGDQSISRKIPTPRMKMNDTPINFLKQQLNEASSEDEGKRQQQLQISNKIKQRREQYLRPQGNKQENESRRYLQTPINRLSSQLISKISKHSKQLSQAEINHKQQERHQVNARPTQKLSTRSQTGLKDTVPSFEQKQLRNESNYRYANQQHQYVKKSDVKSFKADNVSKIIKTITAPIIEEAKQSQSIEEPTSRQSIAQNIVRRRKIIAKNSSSILGQMQDMNSIHSISRNNEINSNVINKLTVFGLRSIFYANFKSSTKKCIIEHNNNVYETDLKQNNLKQTYWDDRIVVSELKPGEDLIFMVYALRMDQLQLQGTAMVNINQLLSSPERHFKFYLYFESIAVGSIEFNIERQNKVYKRLAVSLPEIKSKSPPPQTITSKTIRTKIFVEQASRVEANPSQRVHPSLNNQLRQPSLNSDAYQSRLMPSNEEMTKKVRNIKMVKLSRLGKQK